jgi:antitoxin component HigA of HigAB toxin-antitoxin module
MGIEGTVALASLAAAITTVLIATNIVAVPESLALISTVVNPIGIAALFIAAVYFATLAYCSYKQMHKNEEINGAETSAENAKATKEVEELIQSKIEAKTKDLVTEEALKTALKAKADKEYVDYQLAGKADASALRAKADKTALEEVQESITSLTTNLGKKLNSSDLKEKVKTVLQNPEVTALLKEAISQEA